MGDEVDLIVEADTDEGTFNATLKTRVDAEQKNALAAIARSRQLRTSDIVREALRFYLAHPPSKVA